MSHSLYEIKRLKLKEKQLEERDALMDEKLFTAREMIAAQEDKNDWSWPSMIIGTLLGIFLAGALYVLHYH